MKRFMVEIGLGDEVVWGLGFLAFRSDLIRWVEVCLIFKDFH